MKNKHTYSLYVAILLSMIPVPLLMDFENFNVPGQSNLENTMYYFANLFGFLGSLMFLWLLILGLRGVVGKVYPDLIGVNTLHQFLGKYGIIIILLHPLLLLSSYSERVLFFIIPSLENNFETYVTLGRIACYIFLFIWITSAVSRGRLSFRMWKSIHFLAYVIPPFVFLHSLELGSTLTSSEYAKYYWYGLIILYICVVAFKLLFLAGLGRQKYSLVSMNKLTNDMFELSLHPLSKKIVPQPGQFVYIQLRNIGESHPFSVASFNAESGRIILLSKDVGRFTRKIANLQAGDIVMLDGPYGVFTQEMNLVENELVFIGGGSGIAPFIYAIDFLNEREKRPWLFFGSRTTKDIIYKEWFSQRLGEKAVHVVSDPHDVPDDENVEKGFITNELLKKYLTKPLSEYVFFVCGPTVMMKFIKKNLKLAKVPDNQVFMEKFSL